MEASRRGFISGLISFVAAPAIVRAASLMSVKSLSLDFHERALAYSFKQTQEIMAANILNMGTLRELLLPGLQEVAYSYETMPRVWEAVFSNRSLTESSANPAKALS